MSWLPIIALAALVFALAVYLLKLPRALWMLFGSALLFGLAGYAMHGNPGQPGAPADPVVDETAQTGEMMVVARREFYPEGRLPSRFVVTADAFTRRGQHEQAANFLRNAVAENPADSEAWLALGNALVEHADGQLTAAALRLFQARRWRPTIRHRPISSDSPFCAAVNPDGRWSCGANCCNPLPNRRSGAPRWPPDSTGWKPSLPPDR